MWKIIAPLPPSMAKHLFVGCCHQCVEALKVNDILVDQGRKHALFFIIEMVEGMCQKPKNEEFSPHHVWMKELLMAAPMWQVAPWHLNTADFHLPQNRARVYTIGVNKFATCRFPVCPRPWPRTAPGHGITDLLHPGLDPIRETNLTPQRQINLMMLKHCVLKDPRHRPGTVCCVSVDRNMRTGFGKWFRVDSLICTLRTANELVWLLQFRSTGELCLSRPLHPLERFAFQGFPATVGQTLTKAEVLLVTGNSMSVPVVGSALGQILKTLLAAGVLQPRAAQPSSVSLAERVFRAGLKRKLAEEIAALDGQAMAYQALLQRIGPHSRRRFRPGSQI
jgi:hypothetical protein